MQLVGFIVKIYHDARSSECQMIESCNLKIVASTVTPVVLIHTIDTQHDIKCNSGQTYTLFWGVNKFLHLLFTFRDRPG